MKRAQVVTALWVGQLIIDLVVAGYAIVTIVFAYLSFYSPARSIENCETCGASAPPPSLLEWFSMTQYEYWIPMIAVSILGIVILRLDRRIQEIIWIPIVVFLLKLAYALLLGLILGDVTIQSRVL